MTDVTIRRAALADIADIQRLYGQLDRHHAEPLAGVFQALEGDARGNEIIPVPTLHPHAPPNRNQLCPESVESS